MTIEAKPSGATPAAADGQVALAVAWLRRQPKRNLALVALVPVLVWLWLPLLGGEAKRGPAATPVAAEGPRDAGTAVAGANSLPAPLAEIAGPQALSQRLAALTAPFAPRWHEHDDPAPFRSTVPGAATAANEAAPTTWTPTMILHSDGAPPLAVVQGRPRRIGDHLGVRELVAIEEHRIVWREGSVLIPVALPGPTGDPR